MRQHRKDGTLLKKGDRAYRKIRLRALKRDHFLCQSCLRKGHITSAEEADHLKPISLGGDHSLSNIEAICSNCHKIKTEKEWTRTHRSSMKKGIINICEHGTNLNRKICYECEDERNQKVSL